MARNSAMMKAATPITGGMIWPPVEATASIAAATWGRYPVRFISGMVTDPVITTFDTAVPEMDPNRLEATTAILAGPPRKRPMAAMAKSVSTVAPPLWNRTLPKSTKARTTVAATTNGKPSMPLVSRYRYMVRRSQEAPRLSKIPGNRFPRRPYRTKKSTRVVSTQPTSRRQPSRTSTIVTVPSSHLVGVMTAIR